MSSFLDIPARRTALFGRIQSGGAHASRSTHGLLRQRKPVKLAIVFEALHGQGISEEPVDKRIVGLLLELEALGVPEEAGKNVVAVFAQLLHRDLLLEFHDFLMLLLLGLGLDALPGQLAQC